MRRGIIFAFVLFLFSTIISSAQEIKNPTIYFHIPQQEMAPGSEFYVTVFLDTNVPINAFQIAVEFTPEKLEFIGHNDANSIISIWQQRPSRLSDELIGFVGGTFDDFLGPKGELIKLRFKAKTEGIAGLGLRGSNLYLADGQGTEIPTTPFFIRLSIKNGAELLNIESGSDKTAPELTAFLVPSPETETTMVVLNAEDNESGINKTSIRYFKNFRWTAWRETPSSANILAGTWFLQVKAENGDGKVSSKILFTSRAKTFGWIIIPILAAFLVFYVWYNRKKTK